MITAAQKVTNMINSPVRQITAKVEVYNASTLVTSFNHNDKLESISIERACEDGKFFGFGICQRLVVKIIDKERTVNYITPAHTLRVTFYADGEAINAFPTFKVTQTRRDENTNELTIYGYDLIYGAATKYTEDLHITAPYSINDVAVVSANLLGATGVSIQRLTDGETCFTRVYDTGANFEGTETLREALNDIAEATQTVYYVDASDRLVFKRLDKNAAVDLAITKDKYISLDSGDSRRLGVISHITELGDNITTSTEASGTTQYVRDNDFWTAVDGTVTATLVDAALAAVGGLTINQFECSWRGNPLLEIGDKISLTTKDNSTVVAYLLDDKVEYDGTFKETTQFKYKDDDTEVDNNLSSLGNTLKQTYAKVDKAEKQIGIVASDLTDVQDRVSAIEVSTNGINASVQQIDRNTATNISELQSEMAALTEKVDASITSDSVQITIGQNIDSGTTSVTTERGFTFNDEGLTITSSNEEIQTTVSEDGMTVSKNGGVVLTANHVGVEAVNLHATTYLIIGKYSRFEDYDKDGDKRTGCFWVG